MPAAERRWIKEGELGSAICLSLSALALLIRAYSDTLFFTEFTKR